MTASPAVGRFPTLMPCIECPDGDPILVDSFVRAANSYRRVGNTIVVWVHGYCAVPVLQELRRRLPLTTLIPVLKLGQYLPDQIDVTHQNWFQALDNADSWRELCDTAWLAMQACGASEFGIDAEYVQYPIRLGLSEPDYGALTACLQQHADTLRSATWYHGHICDRDQCKRLHETLLRIGAAVPRCTSARYSFPAPDLYLDALLAEQFEMDRQCFWSVTYHVYAYPPSAARPGDWQPAMTPNLLRLTGDTPVWWYTGWQGAPTQAAEMARLYGLRPGPVNGTQA